MILKIFDDNVFFWLFFGKMEWSFNVVILFRKWIWVINFYGMKYDMMKVKMEFYEIFIYYMIFNKE